MFYLCYNILSIFLLVPVLLYHLYRSISRGRPAALAERFGFIPAELLGKMTSRPIIWLHAVSVGESIAAKPLLTALRARYPEHAILVSSTTETGRAVISKFPEIDLSIYFPFDFLPAVCQTLNLIKPKLVIIMETEIWPNFNHEVHQRKIPLLLVNGRISDRSYRGYLRFSWFFTHPLGFFSRLCMQTPVDAERIIAVGAPPERVITVGNLKYDIPYHQVENDEKSRLRLQYGIPDDLLVLTAGSTHPGEEQLIIKSYLELLATGSDLFLTLVPRHPERAVEVANILKQAGLKFQRRTAMSNTPIFQKGEVLLVDTIGEMMAIYALSDIAFVGGSLVPTGGHNLLEPASLGIPSLFGSYMNNFREIADLVLHYGCGIQVESADTLTDSCRTLLTSVELRTVLGLNGLKLMRDTGGATERHLEIISKYL
jgi:3-deoxy-D-manno-octulosonic-acid transferase